MDIVHYEKNILKSLPPKNENFLINNSDIFLYFCSKHRLWVVIRTALAWPSPTLTHVGGGGSSGYNDWYIEAVSTETVD